MNICMCNQFLRTKIKKIIPNKKDIDKGAFDLVV